ncbi:MAG: ATP-binding cassette domain-containing protein [Dongiaceae bacterium]
MSPPLIEVRNLRKEFRSPAGGRVAAVEDVSFSIAAGEAFGLAGLSGSGKSTVGRMIMGLSRPTAGEVLLEGRPITGLSGRARTEVLSRMQMVFQNPVASMNPRRTARSIVEMPLRCFGRGGARERRERVYELLAMVGLSPRHAEYYPHEFSGGQCQRLGIARALASEPRFLFLDEPVSALDVSIQAQILNLLKELQERLSLTYLFVANNLSVEGFIAHRLAIMSAGRIVESGPTREIFARPSHPMTRELLASILSLDVDRVGAAPPA